MQKKLPHSIIGVWDIYYNLRMCNPHETIRITCKKNWHHSFLQFLHMCLKYTHTVLAIANGIEIYFWSEVNSNIYLKWNIYALIAIIFFYYKGPFTNILSKVKEDQGTFSRTLLTTPRPGGTSSHQLLPWTGNNFWSSVRGGGDNRESWTSLWPSRVCDRSVTEELCMYHGIVNQANNILQDSQWQLLPWSLDYQEAE